MNSFSQSFANLRRSLSIGLLVLVACVGMALPANAADAKTYITPDGEDITAMVDCIPQQLKVGDLDQALGEFGKDYLERAFDVKDGDDYQLTEAEEEYRACLQSKGITPMAAKN
ncbi:MAG: hypothetical protein WBA13_16865 [Microcoleaceae cyanobacterium]